MRCCGDAAVKDNDICTDLRYVCATEWAHIMHQCAQLACHTVACQIAHECMLLWRVHTPAADAQLLCDAAHLCSIIADGADQADCVAQ